MDYAKYNRQAWDRQVEAGNRWTVPVSAEVIARARQGDWAIVLTPDKPVPREWFGDLTGKQLLCLAGGGGQQGPVLAAAGAEVTVFDNSLRQLQQDQMVARRESLTLRTEQGDMRNLEVFPDGSFDLVVHPCSNCFVPDVNPVWQEAFRVLKPGGRLMSGFINPLFYIFDYREMEKGNLLVRYSIPYSDDEQLDEAEKRELIEADEPFCLGHSLEDQIGGQLRAGFHLTALYEDGWNEPPARLLSQYIDSSVATLAVKPGG